MKKYIITAAFVAFQLSAKAQTINVHFNNGQTIKYPSENVDYIDFTAKPADAILSSGEAVDLGLSVYWASNNLWAEKPEDCGDYYSWGENKPKSNYGESDYSYYNNSTKQYIDIGEDISGTSYDAATVNYGVDWRMPTYNEMNELLNNCTWEWTQQKGVNGYKVTGKNGNSIFLPAAGVKSSEWSYYRDEWLKYWCSTKVYALQGSSDSHYLSGWDYYYGLPIRPVTTNPKLAEAIDHTQDGLVTDKISVSYTGGSISYEGDCMLKGSILNFSITNGSTETIELSAIQIYSSRFGPDDLVSIAESISGGETKNYSITLSNNLMYDSWGIFARFLYNYNRKKYIVYAYIDTSQE